jgi:iron(III) transport system substrate-binding protein
VPNTISKIKKCAHPQAADALASYLLSPEVEKALALGPSGQIPLNPSIEVKLRVESPKTVKPMTVDFDKAAALWEPVVAPFLTELFANT